jgi:hypothetical protein
LQRITVVFLLAAAAGAGAVGITDWLNVNGTNEAVYMRQREDGHRWTWDIFQTEVWAWRFAVGVEAEFDHPRRPVYERQYVPDPEGNELVQRYGRYRDDVFDVRAGTYDKTLGKGLTLRSYEDRDFGVYQRLDGALGDACVPVAGREWGDVTALWGRNAWEEEVEEGKPEPQKDLVAGGQLTFRPFDFFYLSGSGARAKVENEATLELEENKLYSYGLGGGWRYFDLYGEYATRRSYDTQFKEDVRGRGFYGILSGYLPKSSVSVEYKLYDHLSYAYNNPPPVSVDQYMITGPTSLAPAEWGYLVQLSANPLRDVRLRGGYSYADDKVGEQKVKTQEAEQGSLKLRYDLPWPVVVEGGYEHLGELHIIGAGRSGDIRRTPSLMVSWTPWNDHSFSADFERERRTDYTAGGRVFVYNRANAGYTYSSWLGLTLSYEDTDQKAQESVNPWEPPTVPRVYRYKNDWLWGEVRITWYSSTFQNHVFTVGYGSRRGGLVCSSGVCKQEAAFTGLKVALESSF